MSYIKYKMECSNCNEIWDTAFGIFGSTQIAEPTTKCPFCYSEDITKIEE